MLDSQMSLDPSKKQFDTPSQSVDRSRTQGRNARIVGQKNKIALTFLIVVANLAEERRESCLRFGKLGLATETLSLAR